MIGKDDRNVTLILEWFICVQELYLKPACIDAALALWPCLVSGNFLDFDTVALSLLFGN